MRMMFTWFGVPMGLIVLALILSTTPFFGKTALLLFATVVGLVPLIVRVAEELIRRSRIDLSLPILVTVILLLALGDVRTAAIFVLLILFGALLREWMVWRVQRSIERLSEHLPDTALVLRAGQRQEVKIREIQKGDVIALPPGSRVPVDGVLLMERGAFDESVVTGESKSVSKSHGDRLISGAINAADYVEMRATDVSANSTLAQVQRLVTDAQSRVAPLSRFTSRYAQWTIVVALIVCVAWFVSTRQLETTLALWIALVPAIFAMIVPVSTTLGISILARRGVLIKNAEALEHLTRIDVVAFDKTGTLTRGQPEVVEILSLNGFDETQILLLAASVEQDSEHALGAAIRRKAESASLSLSAVTNALTESGKGISGIVQEKRIDVGNRVFFEDAQIVIPATCSQNAEIREARGQTVIFVAIDGALAGCVVVADVIRDHAQDMILALHRMGLATVMMTGDAEEVAQSVARELGITDVHAECVPQEKIRLIQELKARGHRVAMIGDGINDAPALAEAHVGIAMGLRGVDLTLASAQAVLVHDDLSLLPGTIQSSKDIFQMISANLLIATGIHLATAMLVIFGDIGILGSTLMHQVSSALVLLNTTRLFRLKTRLR